MYCFVDIVMKFFDFVYDSECYIRKDYMGFKRYYFV